MSTTSLLFFLGIAGVIVLAEFTCWRLFMRNAAPISFPHQTDHSSLRFFTFARLRLIAFAHTFLLMVFTFLIFFFLW